jgi:hypothetical protein
MLGVATGRKNGIDVGNPVAGPKAGGAGAGQCAGSGFAEANRFAADSKDGVVWRAWNGLTDTVEPASLFLCVMDGESP